MRASCSAELIAPMSVFLSSGSPRRSVAMRACSLATTSSATDSCTSRREPAQQTCPWLKKMPLTMPSTAWSSGASSKTMLAALPPSSRLRRLAVPATLRWISLPTSVEPVNAILSTPSCSTSACPIAGPPAMTLTTPGGRSHSAMISASVERRQRRRLGGLEHDGVAGRERRGDLPGRHQQREVPGDDLPGDAERARRGAVARVLELVGPARVVEEVRGRERDVDVARLADRLAVVERLEHGELAGALLDRARDAEEVLRALAPGQVAPDGLVGLARGRDGGVDVGRPGLGDLGERRAPSRGRWSRPSPPCRRGTRRPRRSRRTARRRAVSRASGAGAYSKGGAVAMLSPASRSRGRRSRRARACGAAAAGR